jgi:hypothetical protein
MVPGEVMNTIAARNVGFLTLSLVHPNENDAISLGVGARFLDLQHHNERNGYLADKTLAWTHRLIG